MRLTVARLRQGIILLACLLVAVLVGVFVYARYRLRHFEKDLPARLGINIQQTANGFTYSQSSQGHTLFTIHASKLIEYKKGGQANLHDVSITLYGPPGSNRMDKIYGSDFDYDPQAGIASAKGPVQIDLAGLGTPAQGSKPATAPPSTEDGSTTQNTIHVKTSGLTFNQKTGDASTSEHMEFQLPKAEGSSTGASYNSKTGVLILNSQVVITTSNKGNLAVVHATHAQLLRDSKQAFLLNPTSEYQSEKGSADQAIIYFRPDGSAQHIDAQGHVRVTTDSGAELTGQTSQIQLDPQSQPTQVDIGGGVNFISNDENQSMHGNAVEGTLTFGPNSTLKHAQFRNAVSFVDQVLKLANDPRGTAAREVQTSKLDIDFAPGPDAKKSVAQKALATGNALVTLHTIPSKGPQELTTINGDQLLATLDSGTTIKQLDGSGHTKIVDLAQDGSTNTSTGDQLHMTFAPQARPAPAAAASTASSQQPLKPLPKPSNAAVSQTSQVETAIQDGNVVLTQTPAKKAGATADPATLTAWAKHAEYHASDQILHLTGDPRLNDGQSLQMSSQLIDYHRNSGDATAQGSVKATYTQQSKQTAAPAGQAPSLGGQGPVHISADRGELQHTTNDSTFYGSAHAPAHMWQGANSILAPVIELSKSQQTLKAHGAQEGAEPVVNAVLTSAFGPKHQQSVVRVQSQTLVYSDAERRADFRGTVTAQDPDGVIRADQTQVYLTPAPKRAPGNAAAGQAASGAGSSQQSSGGQATGQTTPQAPAQTQIDHIVATGHVVITQPGRKGVGEKLVYTADDGRYVLTGTPENPPHVYDQAKGTTTGTTLIFNSQDDSVVVSGGQSRAVTDTRTPK